MWNNGYIKFHERLLKLSCQKFLKRVLWLIKTGQAGIIEVETDQKYLTLQSKVISFGIKTNTCNCQVKAKQSKAALFSRFKARAWPISHVFKVFTTR